MLEAQIYARCSTVSSASALRSYLTVNTHSNRGYYAGWSCFFYTGLWPNEIQ